MKIYKKKINNEIIKYYFGGISMLDIQKYLFRKGYSPNKIWVYRENIKMDDNYQFLFNTYLKSHIVKKQIGNACMFLSGHEDKDKFKKLFDDIINNMDYIDVCVFDDIELICYSHDFDWLVIALSKDNLLLNDFISYISKTKRIEEIKELNWDDWK